jgi:ferredoxin
LALLALEGLSLQAWLPLTALSAPGGGWPVGARSLLLLGSAGGGLWSSFQKHLSVFPAWSTRQDPLDDYVLSLFWRDYDCFEQEWGECVLYTPNDTVCPLDFVKLAQVAGWGGSGPLGLAVHPQFGPWFALRGAIVSSFVPDEWSQPMTESVCVSCEAPCVSACPVGAVQRDGWQFSLCSSHRIEGKDCQDSCHARWACPVGQVHRYSSVQLRFHMQHALSTMKRLKSS